jgi:hypothetical protein
MFGDVTQINNPGAENIVSVADINGRMKDPAQQMIVWIEDRHYYTDGGAGLSTSHTATETLCRSHWILCESDWPTPGCWLRVSRPPSRFRSS